MLGFNVSAKIVLVSAIKFDYNAARPGTFRFPSGNSPESIATSVLCDLGNPDA